MRTQNPNSQVFKFCPRCGNSHLDAPSQNAFECPQCRFVFFLNTAAAVAALITRPDQRLMVVERNQEPAKGTWDLPGGFCDPNETAEEGLRREIREELGLEITSARYFCSAPNQYAFQDTLYDTIDLAYICTVEDPDAIRTNNEIATFECVPYADVNTERFGLKSIQTIVTNFLLYQKANAMDV